MDLKEDLETGEQYLQYSCNKCENMLRISLEEFANKKEKLPNNKYQNKLKCFQCDQLTIIHYDDQSLDDMLNNDGVEDVDFTGNFSEEQLNRYI